MYLLILPVPLFYEVSHSDICATRQHIQKQLHYPNTIFIFLSDNFLHIEIKQTITIISYTVFKYKFIAKYFCNCWIFLDIELPLYSVVQCFGNSCRRRHKIDISCKEECVVISNMSYGIIMSEYICTVHII